MVQVAVRLHEQEAHDFKLKLTGVPPEWAREDNFLRSQRDADDRAVQVAEASSEDNDAEEVEVVEDEKDQSDEEDRQQSKKDEKEEAPIVYEEESCWDTPVLPLGGVPDSTFLSKCVDGNRLPLACASDHCSETLGRSLRLSGASPL